MTERNPLYIWKIKVWRKNVSPLPHWLIVGNSAIVIGISAALAGLAIGMITVTGKPYSVPVGLVLLPLPLIVGTLQYKAVFRQNIDAAKGVMVILYSASVLFGMILLLHSKLLFPLSGIHANKTLSLRILLLIVCMSYCGFCGWINRRFGMHLSVSADLDELPPPEVGKRTNQFTLSELMGWVVIVSIMASAAGYVIQQNNILSGAQ